MSAGHYPPCPPRPETRTPRRARVVLDWIEEGERHHVSEYGWAFLSDGWLHFASDDDGGHSWGSWPRESVAAVIWEPVEAEELPKVPKSRPELEER